MWVAVALLLAARAASGVQRLEGDLGELAQAVREGCVDETGVDEGLIAQVDGGAALPPDPTLKCYIKCTMEAGGMLDDDGVDVDAVVELLPEHMRPGIEPVLRACGTKKGADLCDTAYLTQLCWQRGDADLYIFI